MKTILIAVAIAAITTAAAAKDGLKDYLCFAPGLDFPEFSISDGVIYKIDGSGVETKEIFCSDDANQYSDGSGCSWQGSSMSKSFVHGTGFLFLTLDRDRMYRCTSDLFKK
ncbi:hypothetical protein C1J03_19045 [Sulfitobacter sp. SK012]|uniref:hypothetical protein n=1 Tax=Sulfitobacter sp. SK012 TaxID=1389005 RepID=UPI000E0CAC87|nr:hypothetical protein [Sulfitobacter sp. SK012]AXI47916.1 hypothetical protein C1J03_19045 [Sulfitobacter sp. SK012]